jgi:hypothetical protein
METSLESIHRNNNSIVHEPLKTRGQSAETNHIQRQKADGFECQLRSVSERVKRIVR